MTGRWPSKRATNWNKTAPEHGESYDESSREPQRSGRRDRLKLGLVLLRFTRVLVPGSNGLTGLESPVACTWACAPLQPRLVHAGLSARGVGAKSKKVRMKWR
jgi:hypothetical protein